MWYPEASVSLSRTKDQNPSVLLRQRLTDSAEEAISVGAFLKQVANEIDPVAGHSLRRKPCKSIKVKLGPCTLSIIASNVSFWSATLAPTVL
jgi:hypothetical protein